ncbi:MAG: hypothetical protein ACRCWG_16805 [Sarcina sp.]
MFKRKKEKENHMVQNNNFNIDNQILRNQLKNELIRDVNSAFVNNLRNEIKKDLKIELKREIMSQINTAVLESIKRDLKESIKKELKVELKLEISKEVSLDMKIKEAREKNLRDKLNNNNSSRGSSTNINNSINRLNDSLSQINVRDEDLIRHFLASEDFNEVVLKQKDIEKSLVLEIKKEPLIENKQVQNESAVSLKKISTQQVAKTEIMQDDKMAKLELDRTAYDLGDYNAKSFDEMFFEEENIDLKADETFSESMKFFAKEQGRNIKKVGNDFKVISRKGYEVSKEEVERIRNSEAFKKYVQKIKEFKDKR